MCFHHRRSVDKRNPPSFFLFSHFLLLFFLLLKKTDREQKNHSQRGLCFLKMKTKQFLFFYTFTFPPSLCYFPPLWHRGGRKENMNIQKRNARHDLIWISHTSDLLPPPLKAQSQASDVNLIFFLCGKRSMQIQVLTANISWGAEHAWNLPVTQSHAWRRLAMCIKKGLNSASEQLHYCYLRTVQIKILP